jgi:hypothetical protein
MSMCAGGASRRAGCVLAWRCVCACGLVCLCLSLWMRIGMWMCRLPGRLKRQCAPVRSRVMLMLSPCCGVGFWFWGRVWCVESCVVDATRSFGGVRRAAKERVHKSTPFPSLCNFCAPAVSRLIASWIIPVPIISSSSNLIESLLAALDDDLP